MSTLSAIDLNEISAVDKASAGGSQSTGIGSYLSGFAVDRNIDAQMTRRAARINASSISNEEEARLHVERQKLLDKQFENTITRAESIRLEYVRWSLDRIDDAKHGAALDALEHQIVRYEAFAAEVRDLKAHLQAAASRRR